MAAPRRLPLVKCPDPLHRGSNLKANGTRISGSRRVRQYRCSFLLSPPHTFTVTIADNRPVGWQPNPACPQHPEAAVKRNGTYGTGTHRRQSYLCRPADGGPAHKFTPPLPRAHIGLKGKPCSECDELRGVHHGEAASARRNTWSAKTVARGLDMLSTGLAYGKVSRWALEEANIPIGASRRKSPPPKEPEIDPVTGVAEEIKKISLRSRESHRVWHIAADWVEAFAPVIWGPIEEEMRKTALAERARLDAALAADEPLVRPQAIIIDDKPVWSPQGRGKHNRRDEGFHVLVVSEVIWEETGPRTTLRLARAMAKSDTPAWRLVFDELGYAPDFILSDAEPAILSAVRTHYRDSSHTHSIPSIFHIGRSIRHALGIATTYNAPIEHHLNLLARGSVALASVEAWQQWWDDLAVLVDESGLPRAKFSNQRRNYEGAMAAALPYLLANPDVFLSTGGIETQIREIDRVLLLRTQFANIERTNHLFDLVVARAHGAFTHLDEVAHQLRADTSAYDGWTVAMRSIADPGRYSSLRDPALIADLATSRGL